MIQINQYIIEKLKVNDNVKNDTLSLWWHLNKETTGAFWSTIDKITRNYTNGFILFKTPVEQSEDYEEDYIRYKEDLGELFESIFDNDEDFKKYNDVILKDGCIIITHVPAKKDQCYWIYALTPDGQDSIKAYKDGDIDNLDCFINPVNVIKKIKI